MSTVGHSYSPQLQGITKALQDIATELQGIRMRPVPPSVGPAPAGLPRDPFAPLPVVPIKTIEEYENALAEVRADREKAGQELERLAVENRELSGRLDHAQRATATLLGLLVDTLGGQR